MAAFQRVTRLFLVASAVCLLLALSGSAFADGPVTVTLKEQNGSGISGVATLIDAGNGKTLVSLKLTNAGKGQQPVHIHPGSCAKLDPKPKFPLTNVTNGVSVTTVEAPIATLAAGDMAINVHKSSEEIQVYVACGDIALTGAGAGATLPATGSADLNWPLIALFGLLGVAAFGLGLRLRRRAA